jgi:hypothetical protein
MIQQLAPMSLASHNTMGKENTAPLGVLNDQTHAWPDFTSITTHCTVGGGYCASKVKIDLNDGIIFIDDLQLKPFHPLP